MRYSINLVLALVVCLFTLTGCEVTLTGSENIERESIDPVVQKDPMLCGKEDPELKKLAGPVKDGFPGMPDHPGKIEIFLRPGDRGMINALRCMMSNDWTRAMLRDPRTDIIVAGPLNELRFVNKAEPKNQNDVKYLAFEKWADSGNSLGAFSRWLKAQGKLDLALEFLVLSMDSWSSSSKLMMTLYEPRFMCFEGFGPGGCFYEFDRACNGGLTNFDVENYFNLFPENINPIYRGVDDEINKYGNKVGYIPASGDINDPEYLRTHNDIYYYKILRKMFDNWSKDVHTFVEKYKHPVFGKDMTIYEGLPTNKELCTSTSEEKDRAFILVNGKFDPLFMERLRLASPNPDCKWEPNFHGLSKNLLKPVPRPEKPFFLDPDEKREKMTKPYSWFQYPNMTKNLFIEFEKDYEGKEIGIKYTRPVFHENGEFFIYDRYDRKIRVVKNPQGDFVLK